MTSRTRGRVIPVLVSLAVVLAVLALGTPQGRALMKTTRDFAPLERFRPSGTGRTSTPTCTSW